jgi:hypothetical protein
MPSQNNNEEWREEWISFTTPGRDSKSEMDFIASLIVKAEKRGERKGLIAGRKIVKDSETYSFLTLKGLDEAIDNLK